MLRPETVIVYLGDSATMEMKKGARRKTCFGETWASAGPKMRLTPRDELAAAASSAT